MAYHRLLETLNRMLAHDKEIEIWIEPKPNEPIDQAYVPTIGHAIALAYASNDPKRVKGLIETAHALLAGLDPSEDDRCTRLRGARTRGVEAHDGGRVISPQYAAS